MISSNSERERSNNEREREGYKEKRGGGGGGGRDIVTSQEVTIGVHIKQRTINKATQLMSSYNYTHTDEFNVSVYEAWKSLTA